VISNQDLPYPRQGFNTKDLGFGITGLHIFSNPLRDLTAAYVAMVLVSAYNFRNLCEPGKRESAWNRGQKFGEIDSSRWFHGVNEINRDRARRFSPSLGSKNVSLF